MKNKLFFIALAVCIVFGACTTFQATGLQFGVSTKGTEILGDFSTKIWTHKFLGQSGGTNLFNISSGVTSGPIKNAIDKEIQKKGGTAAVNITIKYGSNPIQWILNNITFNIWAPATVTITRTVIKEN